MQTEGSSVECQIVQTRLTVSTEEALISSCCPEGA